MANYPALLRPDETYFLESFKGCHEMPRKSHKRGGSAAKRGLSAEQIPVLVVRDRNGGHFDTVLPATDKATLGVLLPQLLAQHSVLCTDGASVYKAVAKEQGIAHEFLNIKAGTRVRQRVSHIQNVNAYDSRLKGWMARFRGVATRHLPNYLGWRRLLDKEGANLTAIGFLRHAMG